MEELTEIPRLDFKNYLSVRQGQKISSPNKLSAYNNKSTNSPYRNRSLFNGIFTVADSLKGDYIIKTLQPDLGSLESFIHLKEKPNFEIYRQSLKNITLYFLYFYFFSYYYIPGKKIKKMRLMLRVLKIFSLIKKI